MSLVHVDRVTKIYSAKSGDIAAVDGVTMHLEKGCAYGVLGESGSGKSTLGRILMGLIDPTEGVVRFDGEDIYALPKKELRRLRTRFRIVFQEPFESLNPRMRVSQIVAEPLKIWHKLSKQALDERVREALASVKLDEILLSRLPHQLSGGQQQRVGIARAIITNPDLLVLDEPTASLDQAVRGIVLDLLSHIQRDRGLTILMISHDLHSLARICSQLFVMKEGRIVEEGSLDLILGSPKEEYTKHLMSSILMPPALLGSPVP